MAESQKRSMLPAGRLRHHSLFQLDDFGDRPNYNAVVLLPPNANIKPLLAEINAAITAKWSRKPGNMKPLPIQKIDGTTSEYDWDDGWYRVKLKTDKNVPEVRGPRKEVITEATPVSQGGVYLGAWCQITYTLTAYENKFGKGVCMNLGNVQLTGKEADMLGTPAPSADEEFDEIDVEDAEALMDGLL